MCILRRRVWQERSFIAAAMVSQAPPPAPAPALDVGAQQAHAYLSSPSIPTGDLTLQGSAGGPARGPEWGRGWRGHGGEALAAVRLPAAGFSCWPRTWRAHGDSRGIPARHLGGHRQRGPWGLSRDPAGRGGREGPPAPRLWGSRAACAWDRVGDRAASPPRPGLGRQAPAQD